MPHSETWQTRYMNRFYRSQKSWVDGTTQFHDFIASHLPSTAEILELGAGPANTTSAYLASRFAAVDGLDIDADATSNPSLRKAYLFDGGAWPLGDQSYDGIVSNYVFEHVADPHGMAAEAFRVLRPGGVFLFRTPNLWHYVTMVSRLTPNWFHRLVANRLRKLPDDAHDPYPTFYRLNTRSAIRRILRRAGFREGDLIAIEKDPSYGMSHKVLFLTFMAYERVVNATSALAGFRSNLLGAFVKPIPSV
jgi:SAM-dependent methyltransferase